jgi:CBS domain-containing protein
MGKTIRDIVGGEREGYSVDVNQSIRQVIAYMIGKNVGAVVVRDGEEVAGVFSERDLLRRVVHEGLDPDKVNVRDVMSSPVYWVSMDERYEVALAMMAEKGLRHLVVMDEQRQFRGMVSSRALLETDLSDSKELVSKLNDGYYGHNFKP